jgi:hypothetical protein
MQHMRYWGMSLAVAICGGFIAIERFAFDARTAVWVGFGVAIAAAVLSLGAFAIALLRENHAFSGLSALCELTAAWIIIATQVFARPTALWQAFAGGLVLLFLSLRALALHETTVERIVHALEVGVPLQRGEQAAVARPPEAQPGRGGRPRLARMPAISEPMRAWMYWLTHTALAVGGALVVLMTFALTAPGSHHASPRWIAFGVGIAATLAALAALLDRGLLREGLGRGEGGPSGRLAALGLTAASTAIAGAMIVTMVVYTGATARWVAFALGCALVGVSLLASVMHEITSDRVRHELEIAAPSRAAQPTGAPPPAAA